MEKTQYYKQVNGQWKPCKYQHFAGAEYMPLYNDKGEQYGIGIIQVTKTINPSSIEVEDIYSWDFPDFCDAFVAYAEWNDGTPLKNKKCKTMRKATRNT